MYLLTICSALAIQGTQDTEPSVYYSPRGSNLQFARRLRYYNSTAEFGNAAQSVMSCDALAGPINMQPAIHSVCPLCRADSVSWTLVTLSH
jgi:hypothetical protein